MFAVRSITSGMICHTRICSSPECTHTVNIFSRPDYTVGIGIPMIQSIKYPGHRFCPVSPDNCLCAVLADYTAGGESHPAPKNLFVSVRYDGSTIRESCQPLFIHILRMHIFEQKQHRQHQYDCNRQTDPCILHKSRNNI